jgi:hypothetical protein
MMIAKRARQNTGSRRYRRGDRHAGLRVGLPAWDGGGSAAAFAATNPICRRTAQVWPGTVTDAPPWPHGYLRPRLAFAIGESP